MVIMVGLAWAMKENPAATAYVAWVGIGVTLVVAHGMIFGGESISPIKFSLDPSAGRLRHRPKGS